MKSLPRLRSKPAGSGTHSTAGVRAVDAYLELSRRADRLCRAIDSATAAADDDASTRHCVAESPDSGKISREG